MSATVLPRQPAGTVQVWDGLLRFCHWMLAAGFAAAFITAEEQDLLHQVAGYAVAAVVAIRLVWGLVGPPHARFSSFVAGPRTVLAHLRDLLRGRDRRYIGHSPAAGAMAVALLLMMAGLAVSGWMLTTNAFYGAEWLEDLHEGAANVALAMVGVHIAAAIYQSVRHRENLPWAMVTGRKRL